LWRQPEAGQPLAEIPSCLWHEALTDIFYPFIPSQISNGVHNNTIYLLNVFSLLKFCRFPS